MSIAKVNHEDTDRIMGASINSLTEDERRARWQVLESRFEEAEKEAAAALAEMQAFAGRCFEIDSWRRSQHEDPSP